MKILVGDIIEFYLLGDGFNRLYYNGPVKRIVKDSRRNLYVVDVSGKEKFVLADKITKVTKPVISKLKNIISALESRHIQDVVIAFEYECEGTRYYTAITSYGFQQHLYSVRLWEDSDGITIGKCNCLGNSNWERCRHLAKAKVVDADVTGREASFGFLSDYRAHLRAA